MKRRVIVSFNAASFVLLGSHVRAAEIFVGPMVLAILAALLATPTFADTVTLTCANGRSTDTSFNMPEGYHEPLTDPRLTVSVIVDFTARTVNGLPIISMTNESIFAAGQGNIPERDVKFSTAFSVDRISGQVTISNKLFSACLGQSGCLGVMRGQDITYDCKVGAATPKF